jgi:hypothetical protein
LNFKTHTNPPAGYNWSAKSKENWSSLVQILNNLDAKWFTIGNVNLMTTRECRKQHAENYIKTLAVIQPLLLSTLPHMGVSWASDGSMIPAASGIGDFKTVTAALMGPLTLVLHVLGQNASILQGELMGLVMGLLLATNDNRSSTLFPDHLNSVRFIKDSCLRVEQENKLRAMNGRSYYWWIVNIIAHSQTMVIHTKSHTNIMNLASLLNNEADHYASKAQGATHLIPAAPIPTFCMDDFTFYRDSDGWVESNICVFTDYFMVRQTVVSLSHSHHHCMCVQLYDP